MFLAGRFHELLIRPTAMWVFQPQLDEQHPINMVSAAFGPHLRHLWAHPTPNMQVLWPLPHGWPVRAPLFCRFSLGNPPKSKVTKSDPLLAPSQCATMANIIRWFSPPESSDHGLNVGRFQDQGILSTHTHTYRVVVICFPPQAQRYGAGGTVSAMSIKDSKK